MVMHEHTEKYLLEIWDVDTGERLKILSYKQKPGVIEGAVQDFEQILQALEDEGWDPSDQESESTWKDYPEYLKVLGELHC
jgi:hypothetical protein